MVLNKFVTKITWRLGISKATIDDYVSIIKKLNRKFAVICHERTIRNNIRSRQKIDQSLIKY